MKRDLATILGNQPESTALFCGAVHPLKEALVCPACRNCIDFDDDCLFCEKCRIRYYRNVHGYFEFVADSRIYQVDSTTEEYAHEQESCGERICNEYLKPFFELEPFRRILDAGCGMGRGIVQLAEDGYEAYGIDLPNLSRLWAAAGNDPRRFFACDSTRMPFPDGYFDIVYSTGVIEHIGTRDGNSTLMEDYWEARQRYADEILRVTRRGGRILIACPNKSFPIDIQHGPQDDTSPKVSKVRVKIFNHSGVNIHRTWGKYHLLSYNEVKRLFCGEGGGRAFEPLPLRGYFGFGRFKSGYLKPIAGLTEYYINHLPKPLRPTCLNPYMLAQIRR